MPEFVGEMDAPTMYVKIQYCGGWGYRPHVNAFIAKIKEELKDNKIQYQLIMDVGTTGNFEIHKYGTIDLTDEAVLIWSKQEKGGFPMKDDAAMSGIYDKLKAWGSSFLKMSEMT